MKAVGFYLIAPIIYIVSYSPFWVLYGVSNFFFFLIYYVFGYRKDVVYQNLKSSFPDKDEIELKKLQKEFFKYLCDIVLESLKTVTWNEKHVRARTKMFGVEELNRLYEENKSIVIVMGHYGNWEWAGPCFSINCKHTLNVVYKPLSNPYFEKMFVGSRTKFGTIITKRKNTLKAMIGNRKKLMATALIADQAPTPIQTAVWMDFLGQDTPVFEGPEKIAKKLDQTVVYMHVKRVGRGYYEVHPTLISETPKETGELEITTKFNRMLENNIQEDPVTWLWSHKRWKYKR